MLGEPVVASTSREDECWGTGMDQDGSSKAAGDDDDAALWTLKLIGR